MPWKTMVAAAVTVLTGFAHANETGSEELWGMVTPIALDVSGRGEFAFTPHTVTFDINADGLPDKIRWLAPGSAFLVLDLNENGIVDSGAEMFGDATVLVGKSRLAKHGYAALAQYDEDGDGQITPRDPIYKKLRLWEDANQNGKTDKGELKPLAYYRITALHLKAKGNPAGYAHLPAPLFLSHYETLGPNGERGKGLMGDVYFAFLSQPR